MKSKKVGGEDLDTMLSLESILGHEKCRNFTEEQKNQVKMAYGIAYRLHQYQERLDNKPYIQHIDRSVRIYLDETLNKGEKCIPNNLIALMLHDCVEDNQNGLLAIVEGNFDIEVIIDVLWMSKPSSSVIHQVSELQGAYPQIYRVIEEKGFLELYQTINKYDPQRFADNIIPNERLSVSLSKQISRLWDEFYCSKYHAQKDPKKQHKVYAEYMFLCMVAGMPRELLRIKATERRDNMQDIEGLIKHRKVRSARTTMMTTVYIYAPRAREVGDDILAKKLMQDYMNELKAFVKSDLMQTVTLK